MASSNVEAIRYLWDSEVLEVEFKGTDPRRRLSLPVFQRATERGHDFTLLNLQAISFGPHSRQGIHMSAFTASLVRPHERQPWLGCRLSKN